MYLPTLLLVLAPCQVPDLCVQEVSGIQVYNTEPVAVDGTLYLLGGNDFTGFTITELVGADWVQLPGLFNGRVQSLTSTAQGRVAGGSFTAVDGTPVPGVALLSGSAWQSLGSGFDTPATVEALEVFNDELYATGTFASSGGVPLANIARWDGTRWRSMNGGLDGTGRALTVHQNRLVIGGEFEQAGSVAQSNVVAWNGAAFEPGSTGGLPPVYDFALSGDPAPRLIAAATNVYELESGAWTNLLSPFAVECRAVAFADGQLLTAGPWVTFCQTLGGTPCAVAARRVGESWETFFIDEFGADIDRIGLDSLGGPATLTGFCTTEGFCGPKRIGDHLTIESLTPTSGAWYSDTLVSLELGCFDPTQPATVTVGELGPFSVQFPAGAAPFFVLPAGVPLPGFKSVVLQQANEDSQSVSFSVLPSLTGSASKFPFGPMVRLEVTSASEQGSAVFLYAPALAQTLLPLASVFGTFGLDLASAKFLATVPLPEPLFGGPDVEVSYDPVLIPSGTVIYAQALVLEDPDRAAFSELRPLTFP